MDNRTSKQDSVTFEEFSGFFTRFLKEVSDANDSAKPDKPAKKKRALDSVQYKRLKKAFDLVGFTAL